MLSGTTPRPFRETTRLITTDETAEGHGAAPIVFGRRLAHSDTFKSLFREGMALVEETAGYLDGDGRTESRELSRGASLGYATESMRLTTRLMQIASWLLLQRAVNEGEMTAEQAGQEKAKVRPGLGGTAGAAARPRRAFRQAAGAGRPPRRRALRGLAGAGGRQSRQPCARPARPRLRRRRLRRRRFATHGSTNEKPRPEAGVSIRP